jgi:hypothetical protein
LRGMIVCSVKELSESVDAGHAQYLLWVGDMFGGD